MSFSPSFREQNDREQHQVKEVLQFALPGSLDQDGTLLMSNMLGEAFRLQNTLEYGSALQQFSEVLRVFSEKLSAEMQGMILLEVARVSLWIGDYERAESASQSVLQLGIEKEAFAYELLARVAIARFDFTLARSYLYKIPPSSFVFSMLDCLICIKLRDLKGAESALRRVFEQCEKDGTALPESPEFEAYQTYCFLLKGQTNEALSAARRLYKKSANDPSLMLILAEIFMTAGAYDEASRATQKAESVFPDHDQAHALHAHIAYAREDFEISKAKAEASLRKNPRNHYARTIVMKLAFREGEYAEAERIGESIVRESPDYSLGHANLGDLYFVQGRYDLAKIEYNRTASLIDSKTKGALLRQARLKMMDGQYEEAAKILEVMMAQIHTYYDDAMCDLLVCYEKMGEQEKKKELLEKMNLRKALSRRIYDMIRSVEEGGADVH